MTQETSPPTGEQLDYVLERLLSPSVKPEQNLLIDVQDQYRNRVWLAAALKARIERRVEGMRAKGEKIPPDLLKVLATL